MSTNIDGQPFSTTTKVLTILLMILIPIISFVVALVWRSNEHIESRREFLRNLALGSVVWMAVGLVFAVSFGA